MISQINADDLIVVYTYVNEILKEEFKVLKQHVEELIKHAPSSNIVISHNSYSYVYHMYFESAEQFAHFKKIYYETFIPNLN